MALLSCDHLVNIGIENSIKALVEPVVEDMGFELVEVEYLQAYGSWVLRLYVDKPGGIGIDDITRVSREVNTILDVEDTIKGAYSLEVSSPGLDRPLVKPEHFTSVIGKRARIRTKALVDGRKNFKGEITGFSDGVVTIDDDEENSFKIDIENIDKARLEVVI
ncbi:MAG: ribosome maturation factor RimP [Proteobacteria bacterium]|nr:ribosome maturation factor RimP [Pseudomonadota bacterium]